MSTNPQPPAADRARAEAFIAEAFADACPVWLERARPRLLKQAAVAEMQKRQNTEFKARFAVAPKQVAA